ncbi:MAG: flagellar hook-length control protein FliK [Bacillus sp. (in: firmicutes)]
MISSASVNSANHKLSEKSVKNSSDPKASSAFMELFNGMKKENDPQTNDELLPMTDGLFNMQNPLEDSSIEQGEHSDDEQQTRNDLITLMGSMLSQTNDTKELSLSLIEKGLHKTKKEPIILENLTKLFSQTLAPKEGLNVQPVQKNAEVPTLTALQQNDPKVEQDFSFQPQFEGKEVVFQSMTGFGNSASTTAKSEPHTTRVSVDQLFSEVTELLKNQASVKKASEFIEAKFSLTPEKLGDIDVKVSIHKGQVFAHFTADTLVGKETLESQLSLLRSSLQQQGFQVDRIEISLSGQGVQNSFSQQGDKSRQEQSQQRSLKKKIDLEEFYQNHNTIDEWSRSSGTQNSINILA